MRYLGYTAWVDTPLLDRHAFYARMFFGLDMERHLWATDVHHHVVFIIASGQPGVNDCSQRIEDATFLKVDFQPVQASKIRTCKGL